METRRRQAANSDISDPTSGHAKAPRKGAKSSPKRDKKPDFSGSGKGLKEAKKSSEEGGVNQV